jgi:hypothetical protein
VLEYGVSKCKDTTFILNKKQNVLFFLYKKERNTSRDALFFVV